MDSIGAKVDDIALIVNNNHHFRVNPFESRIPYYKSIKYCPGDYDNELNLLPKVRHLELSHHLGILQLLSSSLLLSLLSLLS